MSILEIKENYAHKMILGSKGVGKVHRTMKSYVIFTNKRDLFKQQIYFSQIKGYQVEILDLGEIQNFKGDMVELIPTAFIDVLETIPTVLLVVSDSNTDISQKLAISVLEHCYDQLKPIRCLKSKKELMVIFRILELETYPRINDLTYMIATTKPSEIKFEIAVGDGMKFKENYQKEFNVILDLLSDKYLGYEWSHKLINFNDLNDFKM